jgi:hypothetical protein
MTGIGLASLTHLCAAMPYQMGGKLAYLSTEVGQLMWRAQALVHPGATHFH